jgi:hypothetical protein
LKAAIKTSILVVALLAAGTAQAQEYNSLNTYSLYSIYGLGDLASQGFTSTSSMSGITTGVRESRQIDYMNPAGATARDSLAFVLDFGGEMRNFYSRTATTSTSYNTANFHHLAFAFGIGRFGFNAGVVPFSRVGYEIERRETDPTIIANMGDVRYLYRGENGLSQLFFNLGFNITNRIAVGLGGRYFFGNISQYYNVVGSTSSYYLNTYSSHVQRISSWAPVLGAHYTHPMDKGRKLVLGASWQPTVKLGGTKTEQSLVTSDANSAYVTQDTIYSSSGRATVNLPMQLSLGASYTVSERWMLGAEFALRDWSKTEVLNTAAGEMGLSYDLKIGGYYIPNLYDVRYFWKRFTYRGGLRYSQTPYLHKGSSVKDMAATFGVGVPAGRAGALNLGLEVGRRGSINNGLIQETYVNVSVSITILEAWFMRFRYE